MPTCRHSSSTYLDEEPILANVETWQMDEPRIAPTSSSGWINWW